MRRTLAALYGPFSLRVGEKRVAVESVIKPMVPCNNLLHNPVALRSMLDTQGYLYFSRVVPRDLATTAADDAEKQMLINQWTTDEMRVHEEQTHGVAWGIPATQDMILPVPIQPFVMTEPLKVAICGVHVMAVLRCVFGGAVTLLPYQTLDFSPPGEVHGFNMPSVFMNRGTKLFLSAWTPLVDVQLRSGPLVVVSGSNRLPSWEKVRQTYGQHDVETAGITGDGSFSFDPADVMSYGGELHSTSFEAGDLVLTTCYTMQSFAVNESRQWRVSGTSRWIMESDDVGPDPRYIPNGGGLRIWENTRNDPLKFTKNMAEARKIWNIGV